MKCIKAYFYVNFLFSKYLVCDSKVSPLIKNLHWDFFQTLPTDCSPWRNVNFEIKNTGPSFRLGAALPSIRTIWLLKYTEDYSYRILLRSLFQNWIPFPTKRIRLYLFHGKILRAQHQCREKMIDQPPRLKKVTFYLSGECWAQRKSHHFLICAQWSGVKSCAVRISNAILRMTLQVQGIRNMHYRNQIDRTPFRFKHVPWMVQLELGNIK